MVTYIFSPSTIISSAQVNQNFADVDTSIAVAMPSGGIIMWSGSVATIPAGWLLCNGANGTPDLRNRFVLGAGSSYVPGATGGSSTHELTINELPSHNHGGSTDTDMPDHTHYDSGHTHVTRITHQNIDGTGASYREGQSAVFSDWTSFNGHAQLGGASARHTHSILAQGGGLAHNNMPPYYALCYIMKS